MCNSKWLKNTTVQSVIRLLVILECIQQDQWVIRVAILQWNFSKASLACLRNQMWWKAMNIVQMLRVWLPMGIEVAGDRSRNNEHKLHTMKKSGSSSERINNPQDSTRVSGIFQAHYKNLNSLKSNLKRDKKRFMFFRSKDNQSMADHRDSWAKDLLINFNPWTLISFKQRTFMFCFLMAILPTCGM